jgi:hypothetical protein
VKNPRAGLATEYDIQVDVAWTRGIQSAEIMLGWFNVQASPLPLIKCLGDTHIHGIGCSHVNVEAILHIAERAP